MNDIVNDQALTHLGPAESLLAAILSRPKSVAIICVVALTALGWCTCALLASDPSAIWSNAFCRPALGPASAIDAALLLAMWAAMALAMMVPTAGPMILTYAEIADTAARKSEQVVSPLVLAGGYATVWLGFAAGATLLQMLAVVITGAVAPPAQTAPALILIAGLYQFAPLKQACLSRCQRPFPFFFANWTTQPRGVFALGLRQGLYCLGCCWALMLIMFAVGAMNALWMVALGVLMTIEKMSTTATLSRALGFALVAAGIALLAMGNI